MDRRTILALVLMAIVFIVTPILFPSRQPEPAADSTAAITSPPSSTTSSSGSAPAPTAAAKSETSSAATTQSAAAPPATSTAASATPRAGQSVATTSALRPTQSVVLAAPKARLTLLNPGASFGSVTVPGYRDLRPGTRDTVVLQQSSTRRPLLRYWILAGADTIVLDTVSFAVQTSGQTTTFTSTQPALTLAYTTTGDGFATNVRGSLANAPAGAALLIELPSDLRTVEADTLDDLRHLAYAFRRPKRDVVSVPFSKLDTLDVRSDTGAMDWVSARNKYWLVAVMTPGKGASASPLLGMVSQGGTRIGKIPRFAHATTMEPLANGRFAFDIYAGPQSWQELHALDNELENVNPYAGFLHAVVQPFSTIVMRVLLWMKATLRVNYGWVLVIFGIGVRLLLWPLNQKAMRTSVQMQRLQPELTEVQKKYKNDPEKQRDALMKLYADHGMSPLSPMLGCLPALIPMPVLFALYFVFQNTIEFRGVSFLWLPDLSLRDPYYITPLVMGASMFLLSWIGMRGTPPNPQTKTMSYMMPVMFTVMFLNLASGLNLYYGIQNIAALPQQWMATKERAKAGISTRPATGGAGVAKRT